jgi:hypothetical protein
MYNGQVLTSFLPEASPETWQAYQDCLEHVHHHHKRAKPVLQSSYDKFLEVIRARMLGEARIADIRRLLHGPTDSFMHLLAQTLVPRILADGLSAFLDMPSFCAGQLARLNGPPSDDASSSSTVGRRQEGLARSSHKRYCASSTKFMMALTHCSAGLMSIRNAYVQGTDQHAVLAKVLDAIVTVLEDCNGSNVPFDALYAVLLVADGGVAPQEHVESDDEGEGDLQDAAEAVEQGVGHGPENQPAAQPAAVSSALGAFKSPARGYATLAHVHKFCDAAVALYCTMLKYKYESDAVAAFGSPKTLSPDPTDPLREMQNRVKDGCFLWHLRTFMKAAKDHADLYASPEHLQVTSATIMTSAGGSMRAFTLDNHTITVRSLRAFNAHLASAFEEAVTNLFAPERRGAIQDFLTGGWAHTFTLNHDKSDLVPSNAQTWATLTQDLAASHAHATPHALRDVLYLLLLRILTSSSDVARPADLVRLCVETLFPLSSHCDGLTLVAHILVTKTRMAHVIVLRPDDAACMVLFLKLLQPSVVAETAKAYVSQRYPTLSADVISTRVQAELRSRLVDVVDGVHVATAVDGQYLLPVPKPAYLDSVFRNHQIANQLVESPAVAGATTTKLDLQQMRHVMITLMAEYVDLSSLDDPDTLTWPDPDKALLDRRKTELTQAFLKNFESGSADFGGHHNPRTSQVYTSSVSLRNTVQHSVSVADAKLDCAKARLAWKTAFFEGCFHELLGGQNHHQGAGPAQSIMQLALSWKGPDEPDISQDPRDFVLGALRAKFDENFAFRFNEQGDACVSSVNTRDDAIVSFGCGGGKTMTLWACMAVLLRWPPVPTTRIFVVFLAPFVPLLKEITELAHDLGIPCANLRDVAILGASEQPSVLLVVGTFDTLKDARVIKFLRIESHANRVARIFVDEVDEAIGAYDYRAPAMVAVRRAGHFKAPLTLLSGTLTPPVMRAVKSAFSLSHAQVRCLLLFVFPVQKNVARPKKKKKTSNEKKKSRRVYSLTLPDDGDADVHIHGAGRVWHSPQLHSVRVGRGPGPVGQDGVGRGGKRARVGDRGHVQESGNAGQKHQGKDGARGPVRERRFVQGGQQHVRGVEGVPGPGLDSHAPRGRVHFRALSGCEHWRAHSQRRRAEPQLRHRLRPSIGTRGADDGRQPGSDGVARVAIPGGGVPVAADGVMPVLREHRGPGPACPAHGREEPVRCFVCRNLLRAAPPEDVLGWGARGPVLTVQPVHGSSSTGGSSIRGGRGSSSRGGRDCSSRGNFSTCGRRRGRRDDDKRGGGRGGQGLAFGRP